MTRPNRLTAATVMFALVWSACVGAAEKARVPDSLPGAMLVDAKWVKSALDRRESLLVLDARIASEFAQGHLPGAVNLDEKAGVTLQSTLPRDKSSPVLFYCNGPKCLKSFESAKKTLELGYRKVYWFRGGIPEWTSHGYPLE